MVDATTGAGRTTSYMVERSIAGALRRTLTLPSGAVSELFIDNTAADHDAAQRPERVVLTTADPRFGAAVPRPLESTHDTVEQVRPRPATSTSLRPGPRARPARTDDNEADPAQRQVRTRSNDPERTITTTTSSAAEGQARLDARGRMIRLELGDQTAATKLAPVTAVYDATGLVEMRQGDQVVSYERDAAGGRSRSKRRTASASSTTTTRADRLTARRYPGGPHLRLADTTPTAS